VSYDLPPFPDVESAMRLWLIASFPELTPATVVGQGVPDNEFPFVRHGRVGGGSNRFLDRPLIDVDVFDRNRDVSNGLSRRIEAKMQGYPHRMSGVVIDSVSTVIAPFKAPWADQTIYRYTTRYQFSVRR